MLHMDVMMEQVFLFNSKLYRLNGKRTLAECPSCVNVGKEVLQTVHNWSLPSKPTVMDHLWTKL